MTPYDIAMAVVVGAGMIWGAWKGITWQLASIASLVLGYTVAHPLSAQIAPYLPGEPVVARAMAMLLVYVAVSGGVFLIAWTVRTTLEKLKFEAFDRHLGMLLGGTEGLLLGLLGTLFVLSVAPQSRGPIFASPTGKVVGQLMSAVGPVLPEEARNVLSPFWTGDGSSQVADQDQPASTDTQTAAGTVDASASPASLSNLIESGEKKLTKAIADGAAQGVRGAVAGAGVGGADAGTVERR